MSNRVFQSYNRVKYLMRIKHWRGRSVHSPFLYSVVRGGFMKNNSLSIDEKLSSELIKSGFTLQHAERACRLFAYLNYNSYTFNIDNYTNEDFVVISGDINLKSVVQLAEKVTENKKTVCVVVNSIYKTKQRYRIWNLLSIVSGGVAVDLYHTGYLFLDCYLNKQRYKMRF